MKATGATQRCSRCGEEKPLEDFTPDRARPAGRASACRECVNAGLRARRAEERAQRPPKAPRTHKRCPHCGETKPVAEFYPAPKRPGGVTSWCRSCLDQGAHDFRQANPEHVSARDHKYRIAYSDKIPGWVRAWQDSHRPQIRARRKVWRQSGSPAVLRADEQSKQWRLEHRDEYLGALRQWRIDHPDADRDKQHQRRAAKMGLGSEKVDFEAVCERDEGICRLCGNPVDLSLSRRLYMGPTEEHILPRNYFRDRGMPGLWHTMGNVALAHRFCNGIKHERPLTPELEAEIRARMGLLLLRAEVLRVLYGR